MATVLALERFLPPYRYAQAEVTEWVRRWLLEGGGASSQRLLSVYASAGVDRRASVVPIEEVFAGHDFEHQNDRYREIARAAGTDLTRRALASAGLTPREVGLIVSTSCTGFMIPAVDAYVADALGMGPRLARLPITESGCAGGVVALARACDYLAAHPGELALVLVGREHPRATSGLVRVAGCESRFFPASTHLMGFRLRNSGLQILLDRGLAGFVRREVGGAVDEFLEARQLSRQDIGHWILHPGGRRVVEAMAEQLGLGPGALAATEAVLSEHGNMSSVTVLFVLHELLCKAQPKPGSLGLLGAFGPGFAAELALLEFS